MGTYSTRTVPSVSMEIEAAYQDLSTLLARLIRDPSDLAAIQKLATTQSQIDRLETKQSAIVRLTNMTRPARKANVA